MKKMSKSKEHKDKKLEVYTQALSDLRKGKKQRWDKKLRCKEKNSCSKD